MDTGLRVSLEATRVAYTCICMDGVLALSYKSYDTNDTLG